MYQLLRHLRANAVAYAALMIALGGTSYAAAQIGSADIRDGSVRSVDVHDGSLRGKDVKNGTVRAKDLAAGVRKDIADSGRWPAGTVGTVVEADHEKALVEISDDRGHGLDFITLPHDALAMP